MSIAGAVKVAQGTRRATPVAPTVRPTRARFRPVPWSAPTPLSPDQLLDRAKWLATRRQAWAPLVAEPVIERTYHLLDRDDDVESWLIAWPAGGQLDLHDHGCSAGAFWVVEGSLEERFDRSREATSLCGLRQHGACSGIGFGTGYLHDLRNTNTSTALSVHTYSPPLSTMTHYRINGHDLVPVHTEVPTDGRWAS